MTTFEIKMPKMGESVEEATITKWFVKQGDNIDEEQVLLEIATDKVDSEIPSPVSGKISQILFKENDKVPVGKIIAIIEVDREASDTVSKETLQSHIEKAPEINLQTEDSNIKNTSNTSVRFYSPLVKSIAKRENISVKELETIHGSGKGGRVCKGDVLKYLQNIENIDTIMSSQFARQQTTAVIEEYTLAKPSVIYGIDDEIVEMDRVRKIIAEHMVFSKKVSPHVTNVLEADTTNLVLWRERIKNDFEKNKKIKLTYMPLFIEAAAKALSDFPLINASVDNTKIIIHKAINIGFAVALPAGNLIVPVIKNAHQKNLLGLVTELQYLIDKARNNKLSLDDIQGGTFSITNFGTFQNLFGTPIINQPQVAILATGMIQKKPVVLETSSGDVIAIRHKIYLSLTYDHRIIDGAMGGAFLKRVAEYIEQFDITRKI
jgi:2-oxoglutarate dehydrogenase E2 component (dihydrolipoamide succinyltransferase)